MKIAFLTAACILPGHPERRPDAWEHDRELAVLRPACAARGLDLHVVVWNDPALCADHYDAFVIGTTWDYAGRPEEFVATLTIQHNGRAVLSNRVINLKI